MKIKIKKRCIGCNNLRIIAKKKLPPTPMVQSMKTFHDEILDKILSQKASSLIEEELLPAEKSVSGKVVFKKCEKLGDMWVPEDYTPLITK